METSLNEVRTGGLNRLWQAAMAYWLRDRDRAVYLQIAWDRLTDSGDYAPGGHYDTLFPGWRDADTTPRQVAWSRAVAAIQPPHVAIAVAADDPVANITDIASG